MSSDESGITIDEMYGDPGITDVDLRAKLDRSLNPRGPEMLYDDMARLGVGAGHVVLDLGCRDGKQACELAKRFACRVIAVDPVAHNVACASALVRERGVAASVEVKLGRAESIPVGDRAVDFVWCRDVLNHVRPLEVAFRECARVLRAAGSMLVFQTFATELLETNEASRLFAALATVPENMSREHFERCAERAGLSVVSRDPIGSEWREHREEHGQGAPSKQLLTIARMRRDRERLVAELGRVVYETELADCHWGVYQMLGKLCPTVYILRNAATR